jgi:hypothetical protein
MNDLQRRWARLAEAARRGSPPSSSTAPTPEWVERVARRGLRVRADGQPRASERLAWAGLATFAAVAVAAVLLWPGPFLSTAESAAARVRSLPREVPRAPRLPTAPRAPRPSLPRAESALAALNRWPELPLDFPFTSSRTERP